MLTASLLVAFDVFILLLLSLILSLLIMLQILLLLVLKVALTFWFYLLLSVQFKLFVTALLAVETTLSFAWANFYYYNYTLRIFKSIDSSWTKPLSAMQPFSLFSNVLVTGDCKFARSLLTTPCGSKLFFAYYKNVLLSTRMSFSSVYRERSGKHNSYKEASLNVSWLKSSNKSSLSDYYWLLLLLSLLSLLLSSASLHSF